MLKKIIWPASFSIEGSKEPVSAQKIILEIVMSREYWRSNYEAICVGDIICDELVKENSETILTQSQHEKLLNAAKLEGQSIQPPSVNRFYLKIMKAIHLASDIKEG